MYTLENCPYCLKAKKLFAFFNCNVEFIDGKSEDWPTVPAIYKINENGTRTLIGGFDQLVLHGQQNGF
jgi:hypothetical protein